MMSSCDFEANAIGDNVTDICVDRRSLRPGAIARAKVILGLCHRMIHDVPNVRIRVKTMTGIQIEPLPGEDGIVDAILRRFEGLAPAEPTVLLRTVKWPSCSKDTWKGREDGACAASLVEWFPHSAWDFCGTRRLVPWLWAALVLVGCNPTGTVYSGTYPGRDGDVYFHAVRESESGSSSKSRWRLLLPPANLGVFHGMVHRSKVYFGAGDLIGSWYSLPALSVPHPLVQLAAGIKSALRIMFGPAFPVIWKRCVDMLDNTDMVDLRRIDEYAKSNAATPGAIGSESRAQLAGVVVDVLDDRDWYHIWAYMNARIGNLRSEEYRDRTGEPAYPPDILKDVVREALGPYPTAGHTYWAMRTGDFFVVLAQALFMTFNYMGIMPVAPLAKMSLIPTVVNVPQTDVTVLWGPGRNHRDIEYAQALLPGHHSLPMCMLLEACVSLRHQLLVACDVRYTGT